LGRSEAFGQKRGIGKFLIFKYSNLERSKASGQKRGIGKFVILERSEKKYSPVF
jgi:hypothetical protein